MKICWLCNYFSPYAMKHMDMIASNKDIEMTAIMLGGKDENRNEEWTNNVSNFKVVLIDKDYDKVIDKLAKENDLLIDSMYLSLYGIKAVKAFKKYNKKAYMQADGGIAVNRGFVINKIMSVLMNHHDGFISSSKETNEYFKYYGVKEEKIYNYRFTSLTKQDIIDNKELSKKKEELRKELGIDEKFTIISVGQPIKRKGFDILLKSYLKTELTKNINIYIIGGTPMEEVKQIVDQNNLENVHFIGLLNSNELKKYYAAADLFVLCTREDIWGLVIEEAMSFGLPIITSTNCVAGVHFAKQDSNTIVCDVEDNEAYAKEIKSFYESPKKCEIEKQKALQMIEYYNMEDSADDVAKIILDAVK